MVTPRHALNRCGREAERGGEEPVATPAEGEGGKVQCGPQAALEEGLR